MSDLARLSGPAERPSPPTAEAATGDFGPSRERSLYARTMRR